MTNIRNAIGLMSGTSMDGIDVAHIATDGETHIEHLHTASFPYGAEDRALIAHAMRDAAIMTAPAQRPGPVARAEEMITRRHIEAVDSFLSKSGISARHIDVIGFHGQTVLHRPEEGWTVQIGNGAELALRTDIDSVADLRANDMAHGGQGAPLAPVYHGALAARMPDRPVAFVNIGGVSNVTWVGPDGKLLAFDTGPGNALMDDWAMQHAGTPVDLDGALARSGTCNEAILHDYLLLDYFARPVPKSLDRGDFTLEPVAGLSAADGAATLAHLTAASVIRAEAWFPDLPVTWVICGGGRKNRFLMELLAWYADAAVVPAEAIGCDGDAIEAEAWAYMAVRSLRGLPLTFPGTTGVSEPLSGGVLHRAGRESKVRTS